MYDPRIMQLEWRKIHNSSISRFLIYLNWWSAFVVGGLCFIPELPNGCQPRTDSPFMSSWIELFTFAMLLLQGVLLSVLTNKLDTEELVNVADSIVLIYHGISLILPVMFTFLTNTMTEWTIEASKTILRNHFGQHLANTYYNHLATIKYIESMGVRVATSGLCQYGRQLCMRIETTTGLTRYRSCYTNYYLISVQIFVALSIITPFMMKFLEVMVPPGIREPLLVLRPIKPPTSKSRHWLKWLSLTSCWKRKTSPLTNHKGHGGRQFRYHLDDGQVAGPSSAC